jgi:hypothetical protein
MTEIERIDKLAENRTKVADMMKRVIRRIEESTIKEDEIKVAENPQEWYLTLPRIYNEGQMEFSPNQFIEFESAVKRGNEIISREIERYVGAAKKIVEEKPENIVSSSFWEPILLKWKTYALPNFMNFPQLGKKAEFKSNYDSDKCHYLEGGRIGFRVIMNEENVLIPVFYVNGSHQGVIEEIAEDMKRFNPKGLEHHLTSFNRIENLAPCFRDINR